MFTQSCILAHSQEKKKKVDQHAYITELKKHLLQLEKIYKHICQKAEEALDHSHLTRRETLV